ncbi:hypothetical protein LAZ67_X003009 [Cordylochernes scorpioides]|uniref:Integrase p58-like C-terminal domain-containing protein n=1 Tax=Cordylochernes scorpioides TaxID=51811 RepID=A0ABY6LWE5_9ARAC|nr:hypothetical protein LAZ67_X003009 [Cordylochernes scorpioides]
MRRYFGPYKVTRKISDVTYEVETFGNQQGHRKTKDLVHVCRMKPYLNLEEHLEEDPEDDSPSVQEEDIPTERTQQPQTREEISGPITRSRALRLRISKRRPCRICLNRGHAGRFHPENRCWFREKAVQASPAASFMSVPSRSMDTLTQTAAPSSECRPAPPQHS